MSELIALAHPSPPPTHVLLLMVFLALLVTLVAILLAEIVGGDR